MSSQEQHFRPMDKRYLPRVVITPRGFGTPVIEELEDRSSVMRALLAVLCTYQAENILSPEVTTIQRAFGTRSRFRKSDNLPGIPVLFSQSRFRLMANC